MGINPQNVAQLKVNERFGLISTVKEYALKASGLGAHSSSIRSRHDGCRLFLTVLTVNIRSWHSSSTRIIMSRFQLRVPD
jgi:hypothetical protein